MSFETKLCLSLFHTRRQIGIYIFPGRNTLVPMMALLNRKTSYLVWLQLPFYTVIITLNLYGSALGSLVNTLGQVRKMRNVHDFTDAQGKP